MDLQANTHHRLAALYLNNRLSYHSWRDEAMSMAAISIPSVLSLNTGSATELTKTAQLHKQHKISEFVIANLTTNEPQVSTITFRAAPLPRSSLADKCRLLKLHVKDHAELYADALLDITLLVAICAFIILIAAILWTYLIHLHTSIKMGQLVYVATGATVGMEHMASQTFWITLFTGIGAVGLAEAGYRLTRSSSELFSSLKEFLQNPCELHEHIDYHPSSATDIKIEKLSNRSEETTIYDPITLDDLKKEWLHAPRFIKVGTYLFALDSLLLRLFEKPLIDNQMAHPIMNTRLTDEEQEKLVTDLSQFFQISREDILKLWDPYSCDKRKGDLENNSRVTAVPEKEKPLIIQDILLEEDLKGMIEAWSTLERYQQISIKRQLQNDLFASYRLQNFLSQFSEEARSVKIMKDDQEFFTLQQLLDVEKKRPYHYHID